jgi:putative tryptophan/tyrosine transport system substrate-binding protein
MRRRDFITHVGFAAAWPIGARAQQPRTVPTIGLLLLGDAARNPYIDSLLDGLRDLGWIENQTVHIERRYAPTVDQLPDAAAELVRIKVDVIFASSSIHVEAAKNATKTIPIVFGAHADPVGVGHVASLSRPGGNITGQSQLLTELASKQLEILNEAVPRAKRIGVLWDPSTPSHLSAIKSVQTTAEKLGLDLLLVPARGAEEYEAGLTSMTEAKAGTVLVMQSNLSIQRKDLLADLALKDRLPAMFGTRENVVAGGLMSYGANIKELYRHAATQIDKILKGTKPAELPVEQATKFEFSINLKTAKLLGVRLPPTVLARADEVIEE